MTEIFLENQPVDVSEGLSNLITFQIDDIKDFAARNTAVSKTIILPGTRRNNALFGNIFDVSIANPYNPATANHSTNFNASKKADVLIFQGNVQVFKGVLRLLQINIIDDVPEYECVVFGELGGLLTALGNKKLSDLDLSAGDHLFTVANVTGSWDGSQDYVYPLADTGNVSTNKIDYDIRAFRPAMRVKHYLDNIFQDAGYSYSSDLFHTSRFDSLLIPYNQKTLVVNDNEGVHATKVPPNYDLIIAGTLFENDLYQFTSVDLVDFVASLSNSVFTYTGGTTKTGTLRINLHGTLINEGAVTYQILKSGNPIRSGELPASETSIEWQIVETISNVSLITADTISIRFEVTSPAPGGIFVTTDTGSMTFTFDLPNIISVGLGDPVKLNDMIPKNILQRDFLGSILKLFNLYITEDRLKNKFLNITPFVDFYDFNASGIVDWTYKMDRGKVQTLKPLSEINARYFKFAFKQDSDYYNETYRARYGEGYGDYTFDSEFAFSPDISEIPLIFSATPLVGYSGADKIVPAYYKLSNGNEDPIDTNIRILQYKKITGVAPWAIKDGVSTLQSGITVYGYAGHYDDPDAPSNDIHFGVPKELFFTLASGGINIHQFNVYWSSYMAEITDKDSKLLTAYFKLDNRDIFNLDFSKPVYVDGSYFRLNKIIDWNASEPDVCRVELLKVMNTVY